MISVLRDSVFEDFHYMQEIEDGRENFTLNSDDHITKDTN